jgi:tRNA(Ile)-lysidine synthase
MVDLLTAQSGKAIQSKTHRLIKDRENLILAPLPSSNEEAHTIQENEHHWQGPVELRIEKVSTLENCSAQAVYVDKETLNYPLKLRKWKIGDYFYPLGMNGRKKVSKFFKDEKYSTVEKENQWLLCSQSDIVWILGQRLDERFKVTEKTKEILKITWVS